jgi:hypothetical protein
MAEPSSRPLLKVLLIVGIAVAGLIGLAAAALVALRAIR